MSYNQRQRSNNQQPSMSQRSNSRHNAPPPPQAGARDRLGELRAAGVTTRPATIYNDSGNLDNGTAGFLDSIASLDKSMRNIQSDLKYIAQLQRKTADQIPDSQAQRNKSELESASQKTKSQLQEAKQILARLDEDIQYMQPGSADFVMCSNQLVNLKKHYQSYVQEFHQMETQFGQSQRTKMLREMRVVKSDATEDDLDEYMASGGQGGIFAQQVLHSSRYGAARQALKQVEDRQAELIKIEQMVEELANLFLDLNTLIEQQDYTINQVAEYVEEAAVQIESGEKEVEQAIEIRKDSIKWSWYLCLCVIVLIIAIAVYLFVFGPLSFVLFGAGKSGSSSSSPSPGAGNTGSSQRTQSASAV